MENRNFKSSVVLNIPKGQQQSHVAVSKIEDFEEENEIKNPQEKFILVRILKSAINFVFDFLETIVVALSVFVIIYLFIVQPHEVKGSSMEPTFKNNEYIITDKISYRFAKPQRGDIINFKAPVNPEIDYIKRIIALPGETVMISKGKVYVNDTQLEEPYLEAITPIFPGGFVEDGIQITVPDNHFFV